MKNKKVKLIDYTRKGKKTTYMYLRLTRWQLFKKRVVRLIKNLLKLAILCLLVVVIFKIGQYTSPKTIITHQEIIKEVEMKAPILDKIAKCESSTGHFAKNGQVVVRANASKTHNSVDIGKYQINSYYWGAKATELGLNLWVEEDNEKMAYYIYKNYGTEAWSASRKCWSK
jgi:hypothetical protein